MSLDNILGIVQTSLEKAGLKGTVEFIGNEILITMAGQEIKDILVKSLPPQYVNIFEIKPESKIVIGVKIR